MEFKRNKGNYPAPQIGLLQSAHFVLHGNAHMLALVRPEEVAAKRADPKTKDVVGLPMMLALDDANDIFMIWPAPEFDLPAKVRYYPPMVEF